MARATFSGAYGHNLQIEIVSGWNKQIVEGNYSIVNVQVRLIANGYAALWGAGGKTLTINVGGASKQVSIDASISQGQTKGIYAEDFQVPHNPDGTKSVYITARLDINQGNYGWGAAGIYVPLANIARASTGSSANGVIGQPIALNISRHSNSFKHAIWVRFGSYDKKIAGDDIDTSYTWTPEMSMCNEIPDASTGHGTLTYITYSGGKEIGRNAQPVTLSIPDSVKPTFSDVVLTDTNSAVRGLLSGNNFLQIMSNIQVGFNGASGAYGSSITGYRAEIVNKNLSTNSNNGMLGIMNFSGSATIRASVSDSRGRQSDVKDITINVIEYFPPILSFTADRTRENPNVIQVVRNAKIAPIELDGKQKNVMTLSFKVAQLGSNQFVPDNGSASGIFTTQSALTNSAANLAGNYRADKSFDVVGVISDKFTSVEFKAPTVTSEKTIISYDKDARVGIGKIAELGKSGSLDAAGDIYARGARLGFYGTFTETIYSIDNALTAGIYTFNNGCAGQPNGIKGWGYLQVIVAGGGNDSPTHNNWDNWIWQTYSNTFGQVFERYKVNNNNWTPWLAPGVNQFYPIGSIYQSTEATNPAAFMGGTWERFGNGKTLIAVDEADGDFSTVMRTGGAKAHTHGAGYLEAAIGSVNSDVLSLGYKASNINNTINDWTYALHGSGVGGGAKKMHHNTKVVGETDAKSTLQPYVTIYRWRRIA